MILKVCLHCSLIHVYDLFEDIAFILEELVLIIQIYHAETVLGYIV